MKNILITGVTGRFGKELLKKYVNNNLVIGVSRNINNKLQSHVNFTHIYLDLAKDPNSLINYLLNNSWVPDVLINNSCIKNFSKCDSPNFTIALLDSIRDNCTTHISLTQRIFETFWKSRSKENFARNRSVINMSSIVGNKAIDLRPFTNNQYSYISYAVAKSALEQATRYMAMEYQDYGIRVNAISPASFDIVGIESVLESVERVREGNHNGVVRSLEGEDIKYYI